MFELYYKNKLIDTYHDEWVLMAEASDRVDAGEWDEAGWEVINAATPVRCIPAKK